MQTTQISPGQSNVPVYLRIADSLRDRIDDQIYQLGDRLPTEAKLAAEYSVNRHTLRQAVAVLRQEGVLKVEQGRGTFVAARPIRYPIGNRVRYNEALKAQGFVAQSEVIKAVEVEAEGEIATALGIRSGQTVALIQRLSTADDLPICLSSGYFPLHRFPDLLSHSSLTALKQVGSISRWLRDRYSCDHIRRKTTVSARLVKAPNAQLLGLPLNQPILRVESINIDQSDQVIEYGITQFRGDRMELVFQNNL
ncbi:MAG: phosphonate metabolism transcriptional regulator PhnF [Cyanobacteria bacterium P01_A01_bin.105]